MWSTEGRVSSERTILHKTIQFRESHQPPATFSFPKQNMQNVQDTHLNQLEGGFELQLAKSWLPSTVYHVLMVGCQEKKGKKGNEARKEGIR